MDFDRDEFDIEPTLDMSVFLCQECIYDPRSDK